MSSNTGLVNRLHHWDWMIFFSGSKKSVFKRIFSSAHVKMAIITSRLRSDSINIYLLIYINRTKTSSLQAICLWTRVLRGSFFSIFHFIIFILMYFKLYKIKILINFSKNVLSSISIIPYSTNNFITVIWPLMQWSMMMFLKSNSSWFKLQVCHFLAIWPLARNLHQPVSLSARWGFQ